MKIARKNGGVGERFWVEGLLETSPTNRDTLVPQPYLCQVNNERAVLHEEEDVAVLLQRQNDEAEDEQGGRRRKISRVNEANDGRNHTVPSTWECGRVKQRTNEINKKIKKEKKEKERRKETLQLFTNVKESGHAQHTAVERAEDGANYEEVHNPGNGGRDESRGERGRHSRSRGNLQRRQNL